MSTLEQVQTELLRDISTQLAKILEQLKLLNKTTNE